MMHRSVVLTELAICWSTGSCGRDSIWRAACLLYFFVFIIVVVIVGPILSSRFSSDPSYRITHMGILLASSVIPIYFIAVFLFGLYACILLRGTGGSAVSSETGGARLLDEDALLSRSSGSMSSFTAGNIQGPTRPNRTQCAAGAVAAATKLRVRRYTGSCFKITMVYMLAVFVINVSRPQQSSNPPLPPDQDIIPYPAAWCESDGCPRRPLPVERNGLNAASDGKPGEFCEAAAPTPPPPARLNRRPRTNELLQRKLEAVVRKGAAFWNVTLSAAIAMDDRGGGSAGFQMAAAADGYDSHALGTKSSVYSLIPVGSGTKPYTAVACLKQAEAGNLDLDKPIKEYLDPWFAKQTPPIPPLRILWQGHADIERVTTRMLLSMRAGLQDCKFRPPPRDV